MVIKLHDILLNIIRRVRIRRHDSQTSIVFSDTKTKRLSQVLLIFTFVISATSCIAEIEPSAANSTSAIIATLGEYLLALFSLVVILFIHMLRVSAIAIASFSLYMVCIDKAIFNIEPRLVLFFGILTIIISFFIPIKQYNPNIIISKRAGNVKSVKSSSTNDNKYIKDFFVGLVTGILLIVIEKIFFQDKRHEVNHTYEA